LSPIVRIVSSILRACRNLLLISVHKARRNWICKTGKHSCKASYVNQGGRGSKRSGAFAAFLEPFRYFKKSHEWKLQMSLKKHVDEVGLLRQPLACSEIFLSAFLSAVTSSSESEWQILLQIFLGRRPAPSSSLYHWPSRTRK
jgi:hypothetical protein